MVRAARARVMRVCKVWDTDYPWDVRVEKIARSLTHAGHEVHIVSSNKADQSEREQRPEAIVHRLPRLRLLGRRLDRATMFPAFFNPRWARKILRTVRESASDVIVVRDLPLAPTAIWAGRRLGVPVVLDMAENYPAMMQALWDNGVQKKADFLIRNPRFVRAVERWVLAHIDHVLVVIEESRDRIVNMGMDPSRVTVVGNTPPLSRLRELTPRMHVDGAPLELVYLGLLEAPRGIAVLIKGVACARQAGVPVNLTIIGSGREREAFERLARSHGLNADVVRFLGRVAYPEALVRVQAADVGVVPHMANPSWNSTIPNKLFDYMAGGLAVLTSSAKPAARVVSESESGLVYTDSDVNELARCIERLRDATLRARLGASGRRAVAERFNWSRDEERMLRALSDVARAER
jgi:glycosyltransferase involved in cell wall biosynthesis